ncbi:hypothetical protein GQR58_030039 [Nymphon striatum]|nr:hypothetical protein GQR58_030039 [Nymphon striatum]
MTSLLDQKVSRRKLLGTGAAAIGATAAFTALGSAIADGTPSNPADNDVLVVVFLRGGADGLSILPPVAYPSYYDLRRKQGYDIAVSQEQAIGIGHNTFALHPAMAPLVEAYNANNLAFIPAVAAPAALTASRSHFEVQDVMERAGTNVMASDGWLARHVRTSGTEDIPALSMDKRTHVSLSGANVGTVSFPTAQNFQLYGYSDPTSAAAALARIYPYGTGDALVDEGANTLAAVRRVGGINFAGIPPQVTYPNEPFAKQLRELAQLIRAGIGLRVATLSSEGWDSHSDMGGAEPGGSMYDRIRNLAEGLASFRADLGNQGSEVTTVIMSEFGRAIEVNGSGGTDHGRGGLMMVLGQSVNGGIYGPFPNAIENGPEGDIEPELKGWLAESQYAVVEHGAIAHAGAELSFAVALPNGHREGFAGQYRRAEPSAHGLETAGVATADAVQQCPAGKAVGAEAMQDRLVEAAHCGERRVGVQRIAVAVETVEQGLVVAGFVGDHMVGVPIGELHLVGGPAVAAPSAFASNEQRAAGCEQRFAALLRRIGAAGLQDVETLHDENVGLFDDYLVVGQDVIDRVRVDGSNRPRLAALHGATGSGVPDLSPRHCGRCGIGSTIPKGVNGYSSQAFAQLGAIIGSTVREHHRAVSRVGMTQQKCPKSAVVAAMAEVLSGTTLLLYEHAQCFVHHLRRELRREKLTVVVAASVQHGRQDKQQILGGAEEPASRRPRGQFVATGDGLALVVVARRKFPLGRRCELEGGRCGAQRREDGLVEEVGERLTGGLLHQMLQHQIAGAGVGEPFARHGGQHDRAEVSVTGPRLAHRGNRCAGLVDEPLGTAATWFGQEGAVGLVGRGTPSHHTSAVLQK